MYTKNYEKIRFKSSYSMEGEVVQLKDKDGNLIEGTDTPSGLTFISGSDTFGYVGRLFIPESTGGIAFGSDNTPATKDDYKLGAFIDNNSIQLLNVVFAKYDTGNNKVLSIVYNLKNASNAEITVKEMGVLSRYHGKNILLNRDILSNPVVIPAGESRTISYFFKFV